MRNTKAMKNTLRLLSVSSLLAAVAFLPNVTPQAQKKNDPAKLTGINTRSSGSGDVVSIGADVSLKGAQTWHDEEGFHISLSGVKRNGIKANSRGVTVREAGDESTEIVIKTKPGANVTVQPGSNRLDLVVNGGIDKAQAGTGEKAQSQRTQGADAASEANARAARPARETRTALDANAASALESSQTKSPTNGPVVNTTPRSSDAASSNLPQITASDSSAGAPPPAVAPENLPPSEPVASEPSFIMDFISSTTGMVVLGALVIGMILLLVIRRRRNSGWENVEDAKAEKTEKTKALVPVSAQTLLEEEAVRLGERRKDDRRKPWGRRRSDQNAALARLESNAGMGAAHELRQNEPVMEMRQNALVPTSLFGAYRVDQEVGKLVLGQPHRMDVLASRAVDDRRALEASLIKVLNAPEVDENGQRRARMALEEYGFVARQCAALLLSPDAYERASAARMLGDIKSQSSLPFLLEALYDGDQIVRTHAVETLGELKMPSAIGALLDMARRHPEMPAPLLTKALSACSVECFDVFDVVPIDTLALPGMVDDFTGEITQLEPSGKVEELPAWVEDETLAEELDRLESADVAARSATAQMLGQSQSQRSVETLTALVMRDPESSVRGAAVTSLGAIDHESVFAPVLYAFADEAREVRAAAARSLSRLSFDRADAYVRVIETANAETLVAVARACVKAGMAAQAIDRLASEDRRQAYEAFSMLSLLAKANEIGLILEAIEKHSDTNVRLTAVRLLGLTCQPDIVQQLRQLVAGDDMPEKVSTALLEVVYRMEQTQPV
jgi:HEAT repeat protein